MLTRVLGFIAEYACLLVPEADPLPYSSSSCPPMTRAEACNEAHGASGKPVTASMVVRIVLIHTMTPLIFGQRNQLGQGDSAIR